MSRRKEIALVTAGILAGIAVSDPAAQAAAGLMANPSSQKFYLDSQRISLTAYEIGGSNYVKLRDSGEAVDFGITYDAATNTVHISPDKPYETEVITPAPTTPNYQPDLPLRTQQKRGWFHQCPAGRFAVRPT